jgi:hypothetical protein
MKGRPSPTPGEVYMDVKLNDFIEEVKEEAEDDGYYGIDNFGKLERAATAGNQNNPRRQRQEHLQKLNDVATLNFDDFFTQFSILPYENKLVN